MKVSKAIETLTILDRHLEPPWIDDYHDAIKLGIEALRRVQSDRVINPGSEASVNLDFILGYYGDPFPFPLPGETPEEASGRRQ